MRKVEIVPQGTVFFYLDVWYILREYFFCDNFVSCLYFQHFIPGPFIRGRKFRDHLFPSLCGHVFQTKLTLHEFERWLVALDIDIEVAGQDDRSFAARLKNREYFCMPLEYYMCTGLKDKAFANGAQDIWMQIRAHTPTVGALNCSPQLISMVWTSLQSATFAIKITALTHRSRELYSVRVLSNAETGRRLSRSLHRVSIAGGANLRSCNMIIGPLGRCHFGSVPVIIIWVKTSKYILLQTLNSC